MPAWVVAPEIQRGVSCSLRERNNILPSPYLIEGSCLSRIILVKNSRFLKARPFGSSGSIVPERRAPRRCRNPRISIRTSRDLGSLFYHSFISLLSGVPPLHGSVAPNDFTTRRRSTSIIHERRCSINLSTRLFLSFSVEKRVSLIARSRYRREPRDNRC